MPDDKTGSCRMCGEVKPLSKSHIIPELCYLHTFNAKHFATKVTSDGAKHRPLPTGIYERLLCSDCEGRLGRIEDEFKSYWYIGRALPEPLRPGLHTVSGFNYGTFKLFHLSILWRASVSRRPEFDSVKIEPYEEKVRQMLWTKDPGPVEAFPIFAIALLDDNGSAAYGLVTKPQQSRLGDNDVHYFCYAGCEWTFIVAEDPCHETKAILPAVPQLDGTMRVVTQDWKKCNSVQAFVEDRDRHLRRARTKSIGRGN